MEQKICWLKLIREMDDTKGIVQPRNIKNKHFFDIDRVIISPLPNRCEYTGLAGDMLDSNSLAII